ncbi:MAG TPA: VOC family protein [Acidimicrobiales bacterium]|jgi:catechol 2,3-dioxygenase-like lactoylglutathione lyase family enzyme|nr:VOC family protein [Acidimicrobiales bacterium]
MTTVDAPPVSLLTHIALPVRSLADMLAFYERYTTMKVIHQRVDPETDLRTAWLANERDITEHGARFVIVLIEGQVPRNVVGDAIEEHYGFLTSFSHLGISLDTRADVDRVAEMAKEEGCLVLGPMYRNEVVGYICLIRDPDGNNVEFSVEQVLG